MSEKKSNLITRRQAILSIGAMSAGALIKPGSVFWVSFQAISGGGSVVDSGLIKQV